MGVCKGTSWVKAKEGTYDTKIAREATLDQVLTVLGNVGATNFYVKSLAPNDNSKNQPYFGGHLTDMAFIPSGDMVASVSKSKKTTDPKRRIKYQTQLRLSWIDAEGKEYKAPNAKLIYYPQYPEVRFSGFLQGSSVRAGEWMDPKKQGRSEGRWLILGVCPDESIYAYLVTPECNLSRELDDTKLIDINSVFGKIDIDHKFLGRSTRDALIAKLGEVHQLGWIPGQKLNADLIASPYNARNGGGYTLEAQIGVAPNGFAQPDYLGWEVKQFGVTRFPRTGAKPSTLMTPEPDGGFYVDVGVIEFVRRYGYPDKSGIVDRLNFGGRHLAGLVTPTTGLTLEVNGFDLDTESISDAYGSIDLRDDVGDIAASWSFAKLMSHWKVKHAQAVYVPCMRKVDEDGNYDYHYGNEVELGIGTDFELLLSSMARGNIVYDPGIKLERASSAKPALKRRSQFRVNHKYLDTLYRKFECVKVIER